MGMNQRLFPKFNKSLKKTEIKEIQAENERIVQESSQISKSLVEITAESAYFKDLLEKGLTVRKELEQKLSDEKRFWV